MTSEVCCHSHLLPIVELTDKYCVGTDVDADRSVLTAVVIDDAGDGRIVLLYKTVKRLRAASGRDRDFVDNVVYGITILWFVLTLGAGLAKVMMLGKAGWWEMTMA